MRNRSKVVLVGIVLTLAIAFFFLAPVSNSGSLSASIPGDEPIYSSLGCVTTGHGAMYGQNTFGFQLGCSVPAKWVRF